MSDDDTSVTGQVNAAGAFLAELSYVEPDRIGVMGMSAGGAPAMSSIAPPEPGGHTFRAEVALYPWCRGNLALEAPLLIVIGEQDDWMPADRCRDMRVRDDSAHSPAVHVLPGATHAFDVEGFDEDVGHRKVRYDADATADAACRIRSFLAEHLG